MLFSKLTKHKLLIIMLLVERPYFKVPMTTHNIRNDICTRTNAAYIIIQHIYHWLYEAGWVFKNMQTQLLQESLYWHLIAYWIRKYLETWFLVVTTAISYIVFAKLTVWSRIICTATKKNLKLESILKQFSTWPPTQDAVRLESDCYLLPLCSSPQNCGGNKTHQ